MKSSSSSSSPRLTGSRIFIIVLIISLTILAYNYYQLRKNNRDMINKIDVMKIQIKKNDVDRLINNKQMQSFRDRQQQEMLRGQEKSRENEICQSDLIGLRNSLEQCTKERKENMEQISNKIEQQGKTSEMCHSAIESRNIKISTLTQELENCKKKSDTGIKIVTPNNIKFSFKQSSKIPNFNELRKEIQSNSRNFQRESNKSAKDNIDGNKDTNNGFKLTTAAKKQSKDPNDDYYNDESNILEEPKNIGDKKKPNIGKKYESMPISDQSKTDGDTLKAKESKIEGNPQKLNESKLGSNAQKPKDSEINLEKKKSEMNRSGIAKAIEVNTFIDKSPSNEGKKDSGKKLVKIEDDYEDEDGAEEEAKTARLNLQEDKFAQWRQPKKNKVAAPRGQFNDSK